jgi:hypothetical protein
VPKEGTSEYTAAEFQNGTFREEPASGSYTDEDTPADEVWEVFAHDGDTLLSLARQHLKDGSRRKEIARLNPSLKGEGVLADGDKVKLPPAKPTFGRYVEQVATERGIQSDPALQDPNHPKTQDVLAEARKRHRAHLAHAAENEQRRKAYEKK